MNNKLILIGVALLVAANAYCYGTQGHQLVGATADQMLKGTPTEAKIQALLGNVSLERAATLPDELKAWDNKPNSPINLTSNASLNAELQAFLQANLDQPHCEEPMHHQYHYTDIQVFDSSLYSTNQTGANDHDIVQMITYCADVLSGKISANNDKKITKAVAVVLLAHYLGDIHQPLHVGAEYFNIKAKPANPNTTAAVHDRGGNDLTLVIATANNSGTMTNKLHHFWDDEAVAAALQVLKPSVGSTDTDKVGAYLASHLPAGWANEPVINTSTFATDCANEILPVAREAHTRLKFSNVVPGLTACPQVKKGTATPKAKTYRKWAAKPSPTKFIKQAIASLIC